MKRMILVSAVCLLAVPVARADIPVRPPAPPTPNGQGKLVVMVDANARTPRLIVPRQFLAADGKRGDAGSLLPTMMSGLALALAFAGSGVWVARQRRGGQATLLATVACLSVLALGASLCADFAPSGRPAPEQRAAFDSATIIVVEKGDAIQLVISPADLAKMQAKK